MDNQKNSAVPKALYWALGLAAVLAAVAVGTMYGFAVLLAVLVAGGIVASFWLPMLGAVVAAGVIGALVSRKAPGGASKGFLAGASYGAIAVIVGIVVCALVAVANFHG